MRARVFEIKKRAALPMGGVSVFASFINHSLIGR
jgi:hypothetical protein